MILARSRANGGPILPGPTLIYLMVASFLLLALAGCRQERPALAMPDRPELPAGDVDGGRQLLEAYGCGSCHTIPGVAGADALVGPPLIAWAERHSIAGSLPNTPHNLILWIQNPQTVEPGTLMPDMDVAEEEARAMAAYLFTLER